MRIEDIIEKKRDGGILSREEIHYFINGYVADEIKDYQASALLMAIYIRGMNKQETAILTDEMRISGDIWDLSEIPGKKVDKHSTGGVGDKVSLVLGPMVAACGAKLAKMSGRGLGHTGGTLDKLESIPGMRIVLTKDEFKKQVRDIGIAIIGQSPEIDPADKKLYSLRDVTGTVSCMPLIASSIMSKKLASGADCILLDVKYGSGAFMKTIKDAEALAHTMVDIGKELNKDVRAEVTDMDQPLGCAVGNNLEVKEAINTLKGHGPRDLTEICLSSGSIMLVQAGLFKNKEEARRALIEVVNNGSAFEKFRQFVTAQGGDVSYIDDTNKFPVSKNIFNVISKEEGYVSRIDALAIGKASMLLGGGREKMDDIIDPSAGIILNKKIGDYVKIGEILCTLYTNHDEFEDVKLDAIKAFKISNKKPEIDTVMTHNIID
ncbi:MAG: pyrimidine-nucleoside phosphorylase [Erysipelotrichaceae bacterium]|jgi:pyrimidine-nucleoside phosphorylase|nr:pyrimidine-nucleoside phosphorylase [Erysipelotrichaceae bacterium]